MKGYDPADRQDDETRPFALLKNPLPGPPKRSHIRMEFDITDPEDDEFDIEIGSDTIELASGRQVKDRKSVV